ncbi:hypothetical protein ACSSS7_000993 [Eimeria intestinalis]
MVADPPSFDPSGPLPAPKEAEEEGGLLTGLVVLAVIICFSADATIKKAEAAAAAATSAEQTQPQQEPLSRPALQLQGVAGCCSSCLLFANAIVSPWDLVAARPAAGAAFATAASAAKRLKTFFLHCWAAAFLQFQVEGGTLVGEPIRCRLGQVFDLRRGLILLLAVSQDLEKVREALGAYRRGDAGGCANTHVPSSSSRSSSSSKCSSSSSSSMGEPCGLLDDWYLRGAALAAASAALAAASPDRSLSFSLSAVGLSFLSNSPSLLVASLHLFCQPCCPSLARCRQQALPDRLERRRSRLHQERREALRTLLSLSPSSEEIANSDWGFLLSSRDKGKEGDASDASDSDD